ncbi:hypothetical protein [Achromobacter phage Motura]|uniref:Uncharacterized protein n=1 Tax=Achromobacter phage Motura TaxID=2591403 RepID=A0A514CTA2_9CAUD|nr:hypothetical protein H1O15_gp125 [Achromobacter phage Motura]QDH83703.1 hypothetical protein [Achromobacter phage Motura]
METNSTDLDEILVLLFDNPEKEVVLTAFFLYDEWMPEDFNRTYEIRSYPITTRTVLPDGSEVIHTDLRKLQVFLPVVEIEETTT